MESIMDLGLEGKTVFITGGSSGIGRTTALVYGREPGVQVALSYFQHKEEAEKVVQDIEADGGSAMAVHMDLGDHETIRKAVADVTGQSGGIDVLVNNAVYWGDGSNRGVSVDEMPMSQWEETIGINLFGTVKVTQEVITYMRRQRWGRIINVSSDVALESFTGSGPYGSLKAALFGFTANLVAELSQDGILSNVVIPSWTLTDKARNYFPEGFAEEARQAFSTLRVTKPEDVASAILYLGSGANRHVNGEHIKVTGRSSVTMLDHILTKFVEK
jgi:3-oxoacyl-[acyl-carrier protein] reductase